jgi:hypothetical protein
MSNTNTKNKAVPKSKNIVVQEPNIMVGPKRGKKKTLAEEFADITVPTSTINQNEGENKTTKKTTLKTNKSTAKQTTENKNQTQTQEENEDNKPYSKKGYTRPEITFTEQLSKEQIEERLEDYTKVDDMFKVPLGVHIRYFSNINGKMVFRMGGQLYKNTGLPDYVILNSGAVQWSVQVKDTIFYRKMTIGEIKNEYQQIIDDLIQKNKKLKEEIKKLKN